MSLSASALEFFCLKGGNKLTEQEKEKLIHIEDRCKSNTHRIDELEKRADDTEKLVTSVAVIAEKQNQMKDDVDEMKGDIKTLVEKPAKRWDAIVEKALLAVVSALVVYALAKIGIS